MEAVSVSEYHFGVAGELEWGRWVFPYVWSACVICRSVSKSGINGGGLRSTRNSDYGGRRRRRTLDIIIRSYSDKISRPDLSPLRIEIEIVQVELFERLRS